MTHSLPKLEKDVAASRPDPRVRARPAMDGRASVLTIVVCLLVAEVAIALGIAYTGIVDVSASGGHLPGVRWFLETTQASSVERHSRGISVPPLDDPTMRAQGLLAYDEMCVACHGAPGVESSVVAKGLNPGAPDLSEESHAPEANFWVVKHGIRMTGMPAFGETHTDEEIWPIVAFLEELPELDAKTYAERVREARSSADAGHSGHAHSHDRGAAANGERSGSGHSH